MRAYQEREENMAAEQDLKDTDCTRGEGRTKGRNPRRRRGSTVKKQDWPAPNLDNTHQSRGAGMQSKASG